MTRPLATIHTFRRGNFILWADRVPAIHGRVNLFTLWIVDQAEYIRLIGGATISQLRAFLSDMTA